MVIKGDQGRSHPLRQLRLLDRVALLCARQLALQPTRCQLLLRSCVCSRASAAARLAAASRASISAEVGISPQSAPAVSGAHETAPATAPATAAATAPEPGGGGASMAEGALIGIGTYA